MVLLVLLLAAQGGDRSADALMANASKLTGIERCERRADDTDITVCGLRNADHLRVPFVVRDPGDRRFRSVAEERNALLHRTDKIQDMSPFLVGTGSVGVSAGTNGVHGTTDRPLAP